MTHQEIKELAGHRAVSPWIMKLVGDAIAKERKEIVETIKDFTPRSGHQSPEYLLAKKFAEMIQARGEK